MPNQTEMEEVLDTAWEKAPSPCLSMVCPFSQRKFYKSRISPCQMTFDDHLLTKSWVLWHFKILPTPRGLTFANSGSPHGNIQWELLVNTISSILLYIPWCFIISYVLVSGVHALYPPLIGCLNYDMVQTTGHDTFFFIVIVYSFKKSSLTSELLRAYSRWWTCPSYFWKWKLLSALFHYQKSGLRWRPDELETVGITRLT